MVVLQLAPNKQTPRQAEQRSKFMTQDLYCQFWGRTEVVPSSDNALQSVCGRLIHPACCCQTVEVSTSWWLVLSMLLFLWLGPRLHKAGFSFEVHLCIDPATISMPYKCLAILLTVFCFCHSVAENEEYVYFFNSFWTDGSGTQLWIFSTQ